MELQMSDRPLNNHVRYFEGKIPILLEMPHSGLSELDPLNLPPNIVAKIDFDAFKQNIGFGCDSSVPEMTGFHGALREFKPYGIYNNLARVYFDTNRDKEDVSGLVLAGQNPKENHHGVIWTRPILTGMDLSLPNKELEKLVMADPKMVFKEPLTQQEFETLMMLVYEPYHRTIKYLHNKIILRHGFCIHLALHSLPPFSVKKVCGGYILGERSKRGPFDIERNTLPDVILIHNNYLSSDEVIVNITRFALESNGLIVEDGRGPFLGDIGVTKKYGNPLRGVSVIGIEHVSHDTEPERHLGNPRVDVEKAKKYQHIYGQIIKDLLA